MIIMTGIAAPNEHEPSTHRVQNGRGLLLEYGTYTAPIAQLVASIWLRPAIHSLREARGRVRRYRGGVAHSLFCTAAWLQLCTRIGSIRDASGAARRFGCRRSPGDSESGLQQVAGDANGQEERYSKRHPGPSSDTRRLV